jgi:hypothetical protein
VVALILLAGCVTPATGPDQYRDKAVTSVRAATSEVATTRLTVQQLLGDRILAPYADETISASEDALGSIANTFGSVQPPAGDDQIRDTVSALLTDAEDAVAAARVAARRSDQSGLRTTLDGLRKAAEDLATAEGQLS